MSETQTAKNNHGFLFRITEKRKEKSPDMSGECWVDGKHYQLAGWVRVSQKGKKYLNLKFTPVPEGND